MTLHLDNAAVPPRLSIVVPVRTVSEGNARGHWSGRSSRAAAQRSAVAVVLRGERARRGGLPPLPVVATLTRLTPAAPRIDAQNLPAALKACVDGLADAYGVDDGDGRYEFRFAQARGDGHGVRVEIESVGDQDGGAA